MSGDQLTIEVRDAMGQVAVSVESIIGATHTDFAQPAYVPLAAARDILIDAVTTISVEALGMGVASAETDITEAWERTIQGIRRAITDAAGIDARNQPVSITRAVRDAIDAARSAGYDAGHYDGQQDDKDVDQ